MRMSAALFSKMLYFARLHGWQPERMPVDWPSTSWNTEIILRETTDYRKGLVSRVDARGLHDALSRVASVEGTCIEPSVYLAISQFLEHFGESAFLATEQSTEDTMMFVR